MVNELINNKMTTVGISESIIQDCVYHIGSGDNFAENLIFILIVTPQTLFK